MIENSPAIFGYQYWNDEQFLQCSTNSDHLDPGAIEAFKNK
jgi:hypothetical protein